MNCSTPDWRIVRGGHSAQSRFGFADKPTELIPQHTHNSLKKKRESSWWFNTSELGCATNSTRPVFATSNVRRDLTRPWFRYEKKIGIKNTKKKATLFRVNWPNPQRDSSACEHQSHSHREVFLHQNDLPVSEFNPPMKPLNLVVWSSRDPSFRERVVGR